MAIIKFSMVKKKACALAVCTYNLLFRSSLTPFTNMHSLMAELLNSLSKNLLKQLLVAL